MDNPQMTSNDYVIMACGATMLIALSLGIYNRVQTRKGIGIRFLQFLVLGMGIPAFLILALTDKIDTKTIASVIIGVLAGFGITKSGNDEK